MAMYTQEELEYHRGIGLQMTDAENRGDDPEDEVYETKSNHKSDDYNYDRPFDAQDLGDEWDDYCWSADDF